MAGFQPKSYFLIFVALKREHSGQPMIRRERQGHTLLQPTKLTPTGSTGDRTSINSMGDRKSTNSTGDGKPTNSTGDRKPTNSAGDGKLTGVFEFAKPTHFSTGDRKPSTSLVDKEPADSKGDGKPQRHVTCSHNDDDAQTMEPSI